MEQTRNSNILHVVHNILLLEYSTQFAGDNIVRRYHASLLKLYHIFIVRDNILLVGVLVKDKLSLGSAYLTANITHEVRVQLTATYI